MMITAYVDCRVDSHNQIIFLLFLLAFCIATGMLSRPIIQHTRRDIFSTDQK